MPPLKQPGAEAGWVIPAFQTWEAGEFGLYTLEIYVDGRRQRSVAISLRDGTELTEEPSGE